MSINHMKRTKVYLVTLLTVSVMISPLVIMSTHAFTPQIHFTHGVASGDVTSKTAVLWAQTNQDTHVSVTSYLNILTLRS